MIQSHIGLYGILTNPLVGYEKLAAIMVEKGVSIIQLRMKETPRTLIKDTATLLRKIIPKGTLFIVNDDPIIAKDVGADGVHLGQNDMPYAEARTIMGPNAVIGLSTHNPAQTRAACLLGPSYIGVGPVFKTPTKKNPDPVIGLDGMRAMLDVATVLAVSLGGIDHDNVKSVLKAGAQNICAVRCINRAENPGAEIDKLLAVISKGDN